ncbi:alpha/beta hydrolase-fold protein [Mangrovibacterium sp.]|uniref:carboxylesterase family protein n=1 Tax=Mangrovibacterium sp. TaxID=1961364 RepID=UPI003564E67E
MKMSFLKFNLCLLLFLVVAVVELSAQSSENKVRYNYLTYIPASYDSTKSDLYPVIIYLHGRSVSGSNLNRVRTYGLPFFLDRGKKLDFIVIAPQCPWGKNWASENWMDTLMTELNTQYRVDNDRIYLTGMSLGGFGTWELANRYPNRFAAIAPLCGGGKTEWAENLFHIPIWVFHGVQDRLVPVLRSDQMVNAIKEHDSLIKYSRLSAKGHDLHRVYDDNELYTWLSQFTRRPLNEEDENSVKPIEKIQLAGLDLATPGTEALKLFEPHKAGSF